MKFKKRIYYLLYLIPVIYLILVCLLYFSEVNCVDSQINSVGDAIWYSLVTLTTVGYGDIMPVTAIGRVISIIFLVLSTGLMFTLMGAAFSFLTGEAFPLFRLRRLRHRSWYYFADYGIESITMARNTLADEPSAVIIFGEKPGEASETVNFPCFYLQTALSTIIRCKNGEGKPCTIFFMHENDMIRNTRGINIFELPVIVYARTSDNHDHLADNIHFFHSCECCARQYWQTQPLVPGEKNIVLIGFGQYGQNILERAILTNIFSSNQHMTYHIFGDPTRFLQMHPGLRQVFHIEIERAETPLIPSGSDAPLKIQCDCSNDCSIHPESADRLVFHLTPWENAHQILENADRILVCPDEEDHGWSIYWNLQRFYRTPARIDLRSSRKVPDVSCFGTDDAIYTPRQIIRPQLNISAVAMNNIYRAYASGPTLSWEQLDDFMRQSKIAAADHLLVKIRILLPDENVVRVTKDVLRRAYSNYRKNAHDPLLDEEYRRIEHIRWCRFYAYHNWIYGNDSERNARQHTLLRPFAQLTPREQAYHDHAWRLLKELEDYI